MRILGLAWPEILGLAIILFIVFGSHLLPRAGAAIDKRLAAKKGPKGHLEK